ncbi:MAG: transcriptional repressor [Phycisphaerales bacterium]|nr:transcriptional repressor [Phycisphaerales bacterium]
MTPEPAITVHQPLCAVFRRHLKSLGQKYTPERARVLDVLLGMDGLFQADDLLAQMRGKGHRVSKATVYRTIRLLQDAGIISQVLIDDADQRHYQLAYGKTPQDFLVNVDTGKIEAIEAPELIALRDRLCAERGLSPQGHRFMVYAAGPKAR